MARESPRQHECAEDPLVPLHGNGDAEQHAAVADPPHRARGRPGEGLHGFTVIAGVLPRAFPIERQRLHAEYPVHEPVVEVEEPADELSRFARQRQLLDRHLAVSPGSREEAGIGDQSAVEDKQTGPRTRRFHQAAHHASGDIRHQALSREDVHDHRPFAQGACEHRGLRLQRRQLGLDQAPTVLAEVEHSGHENGECENVDGQDPAGDRGRRSTARRGTIGALTHRRAVPPP